MISNNVRIKTSTMLVQISTVFLIVIAYLTTRYLMLVAGFICFLFMISNVSWEQRFSLLFFSLPFCHIFTVADGQSSVYMFLRVGIILAVLLYSSKMITTNLVSICMLMAAYMIVISIGTFSSGIVKIINILLWYVITHVMVLSLDNDNILPITRSLSNGVIVSSIIGMNLSHIPNLQTAMSKLEHFGIDGDIYSRFTGLFNDPNIFTALVCVALWIVYYEFARGKIKTAEYSVRSLLFTFFGLMTMSKSAAILIAIYWIYIIFTLNSMKFIAKFIITILVASFAIYFFITNPEWMTNLVGRFVGSRRATAAVTANNVTSGRTEIWGWYFEYMYNSNCWIFGKGLGAMRPYGRAAHNLILELFYVIGMVGILIMYKSYRTLYRLCPFGKRIVSRNKIGWYAFVFLCATLFFLDGFAIELFHYLIPLCFIYMRNCEKEPLKETKQFNFDTVV